MELKVDEIKAAVAADDSIGFCKACGHRQSGCEPGITSNYVCKACGAHKVYGAEELLIMFRPRLP